MIDNPPDLEIAIQKKWQLGASLISAWLLFLIFALLLGIEWFLRKRWRLV